MIIIDGPDASGKTTLAKSIAETLNGQYIHCSYHEKWNIEAYHRLILHSAGKLEEIAHVPVVIDRWALSEAAYGQAYRGGASYDTALLMQEAIQAYKPMLIYCKSSKTLENFQRTKTERKEMFNDITDVVDEFDKLVQSGDYGTHVAYDFNEHNLDLFVEAFASTH